ncbi:LuxR C-terminal-related transcriptional regulator [Kribbella sp. NBC_01505]|uniref:BTAD domain-containing putative transcriptional regulator n=1 Tax=Kribbella sp. NBC_01505 TaxID=2903580 RepID=UPI00386563EC
MPSGSDELSVNVLGPVHATRDGSGLKLGPTRQRAVFAVLALNAGRLVTLDELMAAVWGAAPPASARGNVHTYVSGLRRALEPQRELLARRPNGYSLGIKPELVDAIRLDQLIGQAQNLPDRKERVAVLGEALELWHGDPLSGVPGPYAEQERIRLSELRLLAHELRAEALLELGADAWLGAELGVLAQEYPLRERFRELQMLALYRAGQHAAALEVFRDTRARLVDELGIEPGAELQRLQTQILTQDPELNCTAAEPLRRLPEWVTERLGQETVFVARQHELEQLRGLIDKLRAGQGGTAWIEGFTLGKSELLLQALKDADCQIGWAEGVEGSKPFQLLTDCLGSEARTTEQLLARVDELCAQGPLVLVADNMQWADEASVLVWHRLITATRQLPLLLIAAARPVPRTPHLTRLRKTVAATGGLVADLPPLNGEQRVELVRRLLGAEPGPGLREALAATNGNPFGITEYIQVLVRTKSLQTVSGTTDLTAESEAATETAILEMVLRNLRVLTPGTRELLEWAALLGTEFTVTDIAAVLGQPPSELVAPLEEAVTATVLVDNRTHLTFLFPLLVKGLYEGIPVDERAGRHRRTAAALAAVGASVNRVAEQLAAAGVPDAWVVQWLVDNSEAIANRAPVLAADLLARALEVCPGNETLAVTLARVLFRLDRRPVAEVQTALHLAKDPSNVAELRQLLAVLRYRAGDTETASRILADGVADPDVPDAWRQRLQYVLANFGSGRLNDLDGAEATARQALAAGGGRYLTAHAHQTLWRIACIRRDHTMALQEINEAIQIVGSAHHLVELRLDLLDNRLFTLQNLDRMAEADDTLRLAREIATNRAIGNQLQIPAAVHYYWTGRWTEALVELDTIFEKAAELTLPGRREAPAATLLLHGIAAYLAGRRGDRLRVAGILDAVADQLPRTDEERENVDFLLVARAQMFEQRGAGARALAVLQPLLDPKFAPLMLRHQWLPMVVRLALDVGADDDVQRALALSAAEAAKERPAARAVAADQWCRGLAAQDPALVLAAADHFRQVGRVVELATALEDAAVLLAHSGDLEAARLAFSECSRQYVDLSANWDLERATRRLAGYGVYRDSSVPRRDALSSQEADIARRVAAGHSNLAIAEQLGLPRRTVQAHVARLLGKLGATSREQVAGRLESS